MAIASRPSKITLPPADKGWGNLLAFLVDQFPLIEEAVWRARFADGKVHWLSGETVTEKTPFQANQTLCYYREVPQEPHIPFEHEIIYQNQHILVACKPHFLPVTPSGEYVNECLLERLRRQQDLPEIVPVHRLDRETAGLVIFSINPESRAAYFRLFSERKIIKKYRAVAKLTNQLNQLEMPYSWQVNNRLQKGQPSIIMQEVAGEVNARSNITLVEKNSGLGMFELTPITGKTHQLRLHMMKIGAPILNDKFYPILEPKGPLNFQNPLQLLARELHFKDPVTGKQHLFRSNRQLIN